MTIRDIARLSGYSIGTVSRVINNHPDVSSQAKEKILQIIEEQNFQPNSNAKLLKQQSYSGISILVKGYENLFFEPILEEMQSLLLKAGEEGTVTFLDEDADEVETAITLMAQRRPKGFLFLGGNLEYFKRSGGRLDAPCVLLTNTAEGLSISNLSSYTTDDCLAGHEVIRYLIGLGHKKIGILGGSMSARGSQVGYRRMQGCLQAFAEHKVSFDSKMQYEGCRFSLSGGYEGAERLLERNKELTAIFALSDTIAIGAMRAAHDLGLCIPKDLSIVGYDGIELGRYTTPRLTTVKQDTEALANKAVSDLLYRLNYPQPAVHQSVPFVIVEGESAAGPRKSKEE